MDRRPIKTRSREWARALARLLTRAHLSPNQVSLLGIVFALAAAWLLLLPSTGAGRMTCLAAAAGCIQLRLLCNMLDGLMAVEGGLSSKTGDVFNDLPDRLEDVAILVAAGYAGGLPALGWAAAVGALLTAYVRVLGGALGRRQDFCGPMAKPHRMFVMTLACLGAAAEMAWRGREDSLPVGLAVVLAGTIVTATRRTVRLIKGMEAT